MKSKLIKALLLGIGTALVLSLGSTALAQTIPLPKTRIQSLDFTNMTFTVTLTGTNLTVFITSQTRLFKNGNYAISKDLAVGDTVTGTMRKGTANRHEAVQIFARSERPKQPTIASASRGCPSLIE